MAMLWTRATFSKLIALKESDREQYRRLVEMVSEKYGKSKPLPFGRMKSAINSVQLDDLKITQFSQGFDLSHIKPPRALSSVYTWKNVSTSIQTKDNENGPAVVGGDDTVKNRQPISKAVTHLVDVDLSAEVAARLNLKDRVAGIQSSPTQRVVHAPHIRPNGNTDPQRSDEEVPNLTKEMLQEVSSALSQRDSSLVLSSAFKLCITKRDLATLQEGAWLNDEVINFYLNLVMSRSEVELPAVRRVYSFSTFFFHKLHRGGHGAVCRWTKAVDLFLYDIILVPLHLGVHWSLVVIEFKSKSVKSYDSMGQRHDDICSLILQYLKAELKVRKGKELDVSKWSVSSMKSIEIPQQRNGSDCGVFVCKYADYIARDQPLTFRQCQMPSFRKLMIWEILNQRLL
uniref:Ubiquitin-like protease family profile domain-containing protein n=1 Tax=Denticeps clupeoides TaxID=299321 RepID=A0AAY4AXK8_9TELE